MCHSTEACSLKATEDIQRGFNVMAALKGWVRKRKWVSHTILIIYKILSHLKNKKKTNRR